MGFWYIFEKKVKVFWEREYNIKVRKKRVSKSVGKMSREEMQDVVLAVMLGTWVWEEVLAARGEDYGRAGEVLQNVLDMAKKAGIKGIYRVHEDHLDPQEDLCRQEEEVMTEFTERSFWNELSGRLGVDDVEEEEVEEEAKPGRKGRVIN